MIVKNDRGIEFRVRVVRKGERYGRADSLMHQKDDPLVEFFDVAHNNQFVSRYSASTLLADPSSAGLLLDGGSPERWYLDRDALRAVWEHLTDEGIFVVEYGAIPLQGALPGRGGWLPGVWRNGAQCASTWAAQGLDKDVAIQTAKERALEECRRYSGDFLPLLGERGTYDRRQRGNAS